MKVPAIERAFKDPLFLFNLPGILALGLGIGGAIQAGRKQKRDERTKMRNQRDQLIEKCKQSLLKKSKRGENQGVYRHEIRDQPALSKCAHTKPEWILDERQYVNWDSDQSRAPQRLLVFGRPGVGKSTIACFIADHLRRSQFCLEATPSISPNAGTGVAIFFCRHSITSPQPFKNVVMTLCYQLFQQLSLQNPSQAAQLWPSISDLHGSTSVQTVSSVETPPLLPLLQDLSRRFERVYIVIDALDEYTQIEVDELWIGLRDIACAHVRILMTSRGDMDNECPPIAKEDEHVIKVKITDKMAHERVTSYVTTKLRLIANGSICILSEKQKALLSQEKKRQTLARNVVNVVGGSFLLAEYAFNILRHHKREQDFKHWLENLPSTHPAMFNDMYDRISNITGHEIGLEAIKWAAYAKRPLSREELADVLSLYTSAHHIPTPDEIDEATACHLACDEDTKLIAMHKEMFEYLRTPMGMSKWFGCSETDHELGKKCLEYLNKREFSSGHCSERSEWEKRTTEHPFVEYAASYWGEHANEAESLGRTSFCEKNRSLIFTLLEDSKLLASMAQAMWSRLIMNGVHRLSQGVYDWFGRPPNSDSLVPALHLLSYFGLHGAAEAWLDKSHDSVDVRSGGRCTALLLACRLGHCEMAQLLLDRGADPAAMFGALPSPERFHSSDWITTSCLHEAIRSEQKKMVETLLKFDRLTIPETRRMLCQRDEFGNCAIRCAIDLDKGDCLDVILRCISKLGSPEQVLAQDDLDLGLLYLAAQDDDAERFKKLLGAFPNKKRTTRSKAEIGF